MSDETQKPAAYRVLARKYRPKDFSDLMVGQEPMVRTLTNAFETGRIAQAYMLTGVRGVGKTTTARILARALNYKTAEIDKPTIDLRMPGEHCQAIMEGRHVDVIEMDAASHTGIDDIREIIEQVRYRPVSARFKVYMIDEVHMLSNTAFNAMLKTLEEPPEYLKFVLATTDPQKVPVTVLSRCLQFNLRPMAPQTSSASSPPSWARKASRSSRMRSPWSPARPRVRRATACRCSTRRSPMGRAASRSMPCAPCSALPTAPASSISSNIS
ncbi:UNVERIFIED_ORG: DNA polymerase III subunit gamma/tau [Roseateles sp. XES5]|nr:DNA polymerase III subunit gamma/tau [Roseateles sp. XES5]